MIETYLKWSHIGDTPTQSMPHFQLHYKSKSGIIYLLSLEMGIIDHRPISMTSFVNRGGVKNIDLAF